MKERCMEEVELLVSECEWTGNFFTRRSTQFRRKGQSASEEGLGGAAAYFERQATLYSRLAEDAVECLHRMMAKLSEM